MFPVVTINVDEIERFIAEPWSYLFWKIVILATPLVLVLGWGFAQLFIDSRQGKYSSQQKWVVLAIDVPRNSLQSPKAVEHIFNLIKGTKSVITLKEKWLYGKYWLSTSFEIASIDGYIQFYVRTNAMYRDMIEAAIYAEYPDAEIAEVEDYARNLPKDYPNDTHELFGGEVKLARDSFFPLRTWMEFEHTVSKDQVLKDPMINLFEFMGKLRQGEQFWVHIMVNPGDSEEPVKKGQEWMLKTYGKELPVKKGKLEKYAQPVAWIPKEVSSQLSGLLALGESAKKDEKPTFKFFTATESQKNQLKGVAMKLSKEGFYCKIRWAYLARHEVYNKGGRNTMWKAYIALFTSYDNNGFKYDPKTMPRDDYFWMIWEYRAKQRLLMKALKSRSFAIGTSPMYLNIEELATLWHFPSVDVQAPLIKKTQYKLGEAPTTLPEAKFGESDDLPSEPLIEVDEQGRPIAYREQKAPSRSEAREVDVTRATFDDKGIREVIDRDDDGDNIDDILPLGPLVEPQDAAYEGGDEVSEQDDDMLDRPFVPPNLPM